MCVEMWMANVEGSLVSPRWTLAIVRVRTGESEIRLVCGNDESEILPHTHKTIAVSLHGYLNESDFHCNSIWKSLKIECILLFQKCQYLNMYFKASCRI